MIDIAEIKPPIMMHRCHDVCLDINRLDTAVMNTVIASPNLGNDQEKNSNGTITEAKANIGTRFSRSLMVEKS